MLPVDEHEADTQLAEPAERAAAGEEVVIAPRAWGQDRGLVQVADDFEAELPARISRAFADPSLGPEGESP